MKYTRTPRKIDGKKISRKSSLEDFKNMINSLDVDYSFVELVEHNKRNRVRMLHKKCGNIFETSTVNYYHGNSCPKCSKKNKLTFEEAMLKIRDVHGDQFSLNEDEFNNSYKNNRSKLNIKCTKCNSIFEKSLYHLVTAKQKCPICDTYKRHKDTSILSKQISVIDPLYELVGEYTDSYHEITIRHSLCGTEFSILPSNFLSHGQRCPKCNSYFTEGEIYKYLETKFGKEDIVRNHIFKDCRYKNLLRFDFYIKSINTIIEYDGEQHYKPIYGENELSLTKLRDSIKDNYCKINNIKIIRIPYWDKKNFVKILEENIE